MTEVKRECLDAEQVVGVAEGTLDVLCRCVIRASGIDTTMSSFS